MWIPYNKQSSYTAGQIYYNLLHTILASIFTNIFKAVQKMKLTVFGKYGPYPCDGGATSGYHLEGSDYSLAFEMGSGVFARLNAAKRVEGLDALILSHLHFDHISDVGVLNYYLESLARKGLYNGKLRVVLPRVDCPALTAISSMQYLQLDFVSEGDVREFGSVRVEFFSFTGSAA